MYEDRVNTNFQAEKYLDSVLRVSKKYYSQIFLEECKYVIRKNKMENLVNDDLDLISSDNDTNNESDNDESGD